jgi:hypothetical protein
MPASQRLGSRHRRTHAKLSRGYLQAMAGGQGFTAVNTQLFCSAITHLLGLLETTSSPALSDPQITDRTILQSSPHHTHSILRCDICY